jgi:hypothetical protein
MWARATAKAAKLCLQFTLALLCATAAAALVLGSAGCSRGDDAAMQSDLTTPRGAASVFTRALEAGDVETAKSAAYAGGLEVEWVAAMARAMSGMRQLVAAAEKKFGEDAQLLVAGKQTLRLSGTLADAQVQLDGDRATVVSAGDGTKFPMKRIDGQWKIDVGLLTRGEDISDIVKQLNVVGEVAPRLSRDVEAGKFKTIRDVRRELSRAAAQAVGVEMPTTEPSRSPPPPGQEEAF